MEEPKSKYSKAQITIVIAILTLVVMVISTVVTIAIDYFDRQDEKKRELAYLEILSKLTEIATENMERTDALEFIEKYQKMKGAQGENTTFSTLEDSIDLIISQLEVRWKLADSLRNYESYESSDLNLSDYLTEDLDTSSFKSNSERWKN